MPSDPYIFIATLSFAVAVLLIVLCFVVGWVSGLKKKVRELGWQAADAEARFWALEEDLQRLRQQEAIRRARQRRWSERSQEPCMVRDDGTEAPLEVRRSS